MKIPRNNGNHIFLLFLLFLFLSAQNLYAQRWVWDIHELDLPLMHESSLLNENITEAFMLPGLDMPAFVKNEGPGNLQLIYDSDPSTEESNWSVNYNYFPDLTNEPYDRFNIETDSQYIYFQYIRVNEGMFTLRCYSKELADMNADWSEVEGSAVDININNQYDWPPYAFYADFNNDSVKEWILASRDQVGIQTLAYENETWQMNEYHTVIADSTDEYNTTYTQFPQEYHLYVDDEGNVNLLALAYTHSMNEFSSGRDEYRHVYQISNLLSETPDVFRYSGDTRDMRNLCGFNPASGSEGKIFAYNGEGVFIQWALNPTTEEIAASRLISIPDDIYGPQICDEEIGYFITKSASHSFGSGEFSSWDRYNYDLTLWHYYNSSWNFAFSVATGNSELFPVKSYRAMTDSGEKDIMVIRSHDYEAEFGHSIQIFYLTNENTSGGDDWTITASGGETDYYGAATGDMFNWTGEDTPEVFYAHGDGPGVLVYSLESGTSQQIDDWSDQLPWSLMTAGDFNGNNTMDLYFSINRIFETDTQIGEGTPDTWIEYNPNLSNVNVVSFADYHNDGVLDIVYEDASGYYVKTFAGSNSAEDNWNNQPLTFEIINTYPNPFNSYLNVKYSIPTGSQGTIALINILGQTVAGPFQITGNGISTRFINADNLSSGKYFIRLENLGKSANQSVILLK